MVKEKLKDLIFDLMLEYGSDDVIFGKGFVRDTFVIQIKGDFGFYGDSIEGVKEEIEKRGFKIEDYQVFVTKEGRPILEFVFKPEEKVGK
jgi:hypothetical protein